MARVRIVGRRRSEERCVICHGALRDQPVTCPACHATTHADCRAEVDRCPTLGCKVSGRLEASAPPMMQPVGTQPIPMRLTIAVTGSGSDERRTAVLDGGGHRLDLAVAGLLPASWIGRMPPGTRCYVYGLPPPGPYLIEVPDGRLALFHPD